MTPMFNCC